MKTNYTKGKWYFDKDGVYTDAEIEGNIICLQPEDDFPESLKNWEYNAKLIAAAPDLLEISIKILEKLEDPNGVVNGLDQIELQKAIKKATE